MDEQKSTRIERPTCSYLPRSCLRCGEQKGMFRITPHAPSMLTDRPRSSLKHPQSKGYALCTKCVYGDYACARFWQIGQ